jgi:hypothetical protein
VTQNIGGLDRMTNFIYTAFVCACVFVCVYDRARQRDRVRQWKNISLFCASTQFKCGVTLISDVSVPYHCRPFSAPSMYEWSYLKYMRRTPHARH